PPVCLRNLRMSTPFRIISHAETTPGGRLNLQPSLPPRRAVAIFPFCLFIKTDKHGFLGILYRWVGGIPHFQILGKHFLGINFLAHFFGPQIFGRFSGQRISGQKTGQKPNPKTIFPPVFRITLAFSAAIFRDSSPWNNTSANVPAALPWFHSIDLEES